MNCDTYLSMLETLPVEELAYGDARLHAATCRDCDRVTRVVAERERNMLMAYGELYLPGPVDAVAARARELSRRRKVALFYRIGLGLATVATVLFLLISRRVVPTPTARVPVTAVPKIMNAPGPARATTAPAAARAVRATHP